MKKNTQKKNPMSTKQDKNEDLISSEIYNQAIDDVEKIIEESKWKDKDINNKTVEQAEHYCGNEVYLDMHNEEIDNIKSELNKLRKKK